MTEAEWFAATDPVPMLEFLNGKVSDRKLRLFAVACYRRIDHLISDSVAKKAIEFSELYADGLANNKELHGNAWAEKPRECLLRFGSPGKLPVPLPIMSQDG